LKFDDLDLLQFMPVFMREDLTAQGFAYAIRRQMPKVVEAIEYIKVYAYIDNLDDIILDELAWQFNVPEYQSDMDITAKRALLKNCLKTHKERGTPAAVEKVVEDIFGDGYMEEWFQYGGDPYHFRIVTSNPSVNTDQANLFLSIIKNVQRGTTVMDTVIVEMAAQLTPYYATALQIGEYYTFEQVV
jgi:phage tail P2-like protein